MGMSAQGYCAGEDAGWGAGAPCRHICICLKYLWKDLQDINNRGCLSGRKLDDRHRAEGDVSLCTVRALYFALREGLMESTVK